MTAKSISSKRENREVEFIKIKIFGVSESKKVGNSMNKNGKKPKIHEKFKIIYLIRV